MYETTTLCRQTHPMFRSTGGQERGETARMDNGDYCLMPTSSEAPRFWHASS